MQDLRVLARSGLAVLDYGFTLASSRRRFIGRKLVTAPSLEALPPEAQGPGVLIREVDPVMPGDEYFVEAWVPNAQPTVVKSPQFLGRVSPEQNAVYQYVRARVAEGGLWPADEATAQACGVKFDPSFGGEYGGSKKAAKVGE